MSKLIGEELTINFSVVSINEILTDLEKFMVEIYEISEYFKIEKNESRILLTMRKTIYDNLIKQIIDKKELLHIGDPLTSAIACILAIITQNIITIENIEIDSETDGIKITYEVHDRE